MDNLETRDGDHLHVSLDSLIIQDVLHLTMDVTPLGIEIIWHRDFPQRSTETLVPELGEPIADIQN